MTEIQTDILTAYERRKLPCLPCWKPCGKLTDEGLDGIKTETAEVESRLMNQVLAELGVQFAPADIFERAKNEAGRRRRPARYQKRFFN